jgi:hypothetical protein
MQNYDRMTLQVHFKEAGLPSFTTRSDRHNMDGSPAIVRLSVSERPMEYFLVDIGDDKNEVEVTNIDKEFKQVILRVKEPRRAYKAPIQPREGEKEIKYETKYTDPTEQRYLMGMDEKHLFISGLPKEKVNTVAQAHQVLKHKAVVAAEKEGRDVKRQGEYFFVPLTKAEEKELMDKKVADKSILNVRGRLQRGGHRPHFVRRMIRMRRKRKIYAQGHVAHEQHTPLHLPTWHRVYKNRETSSPGIQGFVD